MRRLTRLTLTAVIALLCLLGATLPAVASAATGAPTVGQLDVAIGSNAVAQNNGWTDADTQAATQTANTQNVVILQAWETSELEAIKAANPNTIVLMYQNASAASSSASWTGVYPSGVPYSQASSNGWLLDNTSGQTFTFDGENWLYAANVGSAGYQNAWAQNVISKLDSAPWDGVFMDDVNPTIQYHYTPSQVAQYPNDATYGAAMGSFVANVGPQIQAAGKLAIANVGSWDAYGSVVDPWLKSLSGGMDETFTKWGTAAGSGYADEATWKDQLNEVGLAASENKLFLGVTSSDSSDEAAAVYGYATELLAGNGNDAFTMSDDYDNVTSFPEYGYQLGQPTGAYSVTANGVYTRSFADGLVLVNPTGSALTVNLGGSYSGSGLTNASTVTMQPQTGLVLTADGAAASAPSAPVTTTTTATTGAGTTTKTTGTSAPTTTTASAPTTTASAPASTSTSTSTKGSTGTTASTPTTTTTKAAPVKNRKPEPVKATTHGGVLAHAASLELKGGKKAHGKKAHGKKASTKHPAKKHAVKKRTVKA